MIGGNFHTLSSLNTLSADGTARPKSRDGAKSPKKKDPNLEEKKDGHSSAFTDYSKVNKASRSETFTDSASASPRKPAGSPTKVAGEDITRLNGAYLVSGLRHDMREIGKDIKVEVHGEVTRALGILRKEVNATLEVIGDNRDSTVGIIMSKLQVDIHKILEAAGWPLKVDFSPIQDDFRDGEMARVKGYQDMMQQLEQRICQKLEPVLAVGEAFPLMQKSFQDMKEQFDEQQLASDRRHKESMQSQQAVVADVQRELEMLQQCVKTTDLEAILDAEMIKHVGEQSVAKDFENVISALTISYEKECSEFASVHSELASLGEAVKNTRADLAEVNTMEQQVLTQCVPKVECDTNWTQTEIVETFNAMAQTEDKFWKSRTTTHLAKAKHSHVIVKNASKSSTVHKENSANPAGHHHYKQKAVFADAEAMKRKARAALIKVQYNVFDYYHHTGVCQRIATSMWFDAITNIVVFLNAIWISIDADHNEQAVLIDADPVFQVAENLFCSYFFIELAIRFLSFKHKRNVLRDFWFVFDLALVSLMVLETWIMSLVFLIMGSGSTVGVNASFLRVIRIVKILRLSRLARLMRAVPEVIIFLRGIGAASRSVASIMILWGIIIYMFAVFFVQTVDGEMKQTLFENVPTAMNTLLLEGILVDNSGIVTVLAKSNFLFWPVIMGFVLLASITLSYMLIGVLVQIVQAIAGTEKERAVVGTVASHLRIQWQEAGHHPDSLISLAEFQRLLVEPEIAIFLDDVGVDMLVLVDLAGMIYDDIAKDHGDNRSSRMSGGSGGTSSHEPSHGVKGLSFTHFVEAVLNMRGTNPVTVQDVKSQLKIMKRMIKESVFRMQTDMSKQFERQELHIMKVSRLVQGLDDDEDEDDDDDDEVRSGDSAKSPAAGLEALTQDDIAALTSLSSDDAGSTDS